MLYIWEDTRTGTIPFLSNSQSGSTPEKYTTEPGYIKRSRRYKPFHKFARISQTVDVIAKRFETDVPFHFLIILKYLVHNPARLTATRNHRVHCKAIYSPDTIYLSHKQNFVTWTGDNLSQT